MNLGKVLLLAVCVCVLGTSCMGEVYPEAEWPVMTPEEAGLDGAVLDQLRDYLQGRGCITRQGYLVYTWGDYRRRSDVASAVKPWNTFFLWKAVEEGRLDGVDVRVSDFVPCLNDLNPELGFKDRDIRFRHLTTQTSCYGVREAPGAAFDYNDWQMALFFDALLLHVYGASYGTVDTAVLHPLLTDVLQCEDDPSYLAFGEGDRPGRLAVSPRDFCRFGYLFLRDGRWRGQQLLSREHVRLCTASPLPGSFPRTRAEEAEMCPDQRSIGSRQIPDDQCDHKGSYSWLWWVNGVDREGQRRWPNAPIDVFSALGHENGMRGMAVIPSLDMVLSWNDSAIGDMPEEPSPLNETFRLLGEAAAAGPMRGQVMVTPDHPAWLVKNEDGDANGALDPCILCGPGDPEDFLYRGVRQPDGTRAGDQAAIIERLQGTGANTIYVEAVRSHGGDGDASQNPFLDSDPAKGLDEDIVQQWEQWFRALDDSGVTVFFIVYDDSACIWPTGDTVGPEEQAFLDQLVRRFSHHRNWIWCVAEEYAEALSAQRVRNIAAIIRKADKQQHVIAVHKNDGLTFDEFADDPNIGLFAIQCNQESAADLHESMVNAWQNADGRYSLTMAEAANFGFGREAREKMWACAMAGANVMALDWRFDGPDAPSHDDLKACGHLVAFCEENFMPAMAPHDELGSGDTLYVFAEPGVNYVAYSAKPGPALGLKGLEPGVYALHWLNPATGEQRTEAHRQSAPGEHHWRRPEGFQDEVAVAVRREQ